MKFRYLLATLVGLLSPFAVFAATASVTGPATVQVGHTFQVNLNVVGGVSVDTSRFIGTYPSDLLEYEGSSNGGGLPMRSPGSVSGGGNFNFGAFSLDNPVNGTNVAGTLTFKALKIGVATINLLPGTRILSAGVDQMTSMGSLKINIVGVTPVGTITTVVPTSTTIEITSTSHPDELAWYPSRDVQISWKVLGPKPASVSVGFDQAPEGPAETKNTSGQAAFHATNDGVWYVHLIVRYPSGAIVRKDFRVQIDTVVPRPFAVIADYTDVPSNIPNALHFAALDDTSGIARYDVYLNGTLYRSTSSTSIALQGLTQGDYAVRVQAIDFAGNAKEATTTFRLLAPSATAQAAQTFGQRLLGITWFVIAVLLASYIVWLIGSRRPRIRHKKEE
jgi:hypothetical protein